METVVNSVRKRKIAILVLLILGMIFLYADVRVATGIAYPDYELVDNTGKLTQKMIVEDVVGLTVTPDVIPDILGYMLLFAAMILIWKIRKPESADAAPTTHPKKLMERLWKPPRFRGVMILLPLAGIILGVLELVAPFFTNGMNRYAIGYLGNFALAFMTGASVLFSVLCFLRECDTYRNHRKTMIVYLFLILTVAAGFVHDLAEFWGLRGVALAYYIVVGIAAVCEIVVLILYPNCWDEGEDGSDDMETQE